MWRSTCADSASPARRAALRITRSTARGQTSSLRPDEQRRLTDVDALGADDARLPYCSALEAILYFYAAGALIAYMLADHEITRDELFAVGATFTLVAWAFAYSYTVCQAVRPGGFTAAVHPAADRSWMELLFLSFTTLTSTGLGDVIPVKPFARGLVMLEELGGLAYVAMLVSRLVGLTVMRRRDRGRSPAPQVFSSITRASVAGGRRVLWSRSAVGVRARRR